MRRSYSELVKLKTFEERFEYLKLSGTIGESTFGGHRYLNQDLYTSDEWRRVRRDVIVRDNGMDLGIDGFDISGSICVHHMNPVSIDDIIEGRPCVFDMENLISVAMQTHRAIHYGDISQLLVSIVERKPGDTKLW